jgi:hypothetical protein
MGSQLRLVVDLDLDTTPIGGQISTATGPARSFHGWLELASAIETLRSVAVTARGAGNAREPGRGQSRPV